MSVGVRKASWVEYFAAFVEHMPPAHALWRSAEAAALAKLAFEAPVLDLGCGDGLFASLFFGGPLAVGIDRSERQGRRALASGTYGQVVIADAGALPLVAGSFATVFSNCVLEHIADLAPVLAEVGRVLRPGGTFVFTVTSGRFDDYLWGVPWLRAHGLAGLGRRWARLINGVFGHRHCDGPAVWAERLAGAQMRLLQYEEIVPCPAEGLWTLLLPVSALQMAVQRLGRRSDAAWRKAGVPLWRVLAAGRLSGTNLAGGGLVVVARKE